MRRKPVSKPKEEQGAFSLPVAIDISRIELPDIALGPALAGGVASVAATGSARAEASPLLVDVQAQHRPQRRARRQHRRLDRLRA